MHSVVFAVILKSEFVKPQLYVSGINFVLKPQIYCMSLATSSYSYSKFIYCYMRSENGAFMKIVASTIERGKAKMDSSLQGKRE
jgi:hypothetical protein